MKSRTHLLVLAFLIVAQGGLMLGPMREETAVVDETTFMGGGYAYLKTGSCKMAEENPILVQMIMAAPMLAFDVHVTEQARALMEGRAFSPIGWPWSGPPKRLEELFPHGINWYHYGLAEAQYFGKILVYDPQNSAERLLFWSRFVMMLFTLGTTVLVFLWTRQLARNDWAGVMAAAVWVLNPIALAYGHLAITEPGIAFAYPLAVWWFVRTVEHPTTRNVVVLGVLTAVAMQMKFLTLILGPTFVVLLGLIWLRGRRIAPAKTMAKWVTFFFAGAWVTTLAVYFPHIAPPPPIDSAQADALGVPQWFQALRPLLLPGDFFKAVAQKLLHSQAGQDAYLCGEWRKMGWWYYYLAAMWFKTPIPLLALIAVGASLLLWRVRNAAFASLVPWVAAGLFVASTLTSKIDIGVRHMLPLYPLLAVGIATEFAKASQKTRIGGWLAILWLAVVAMFAYPQFIPYTNEFGGGTANGYKVLIDSNYDWGQDGKRLKQWMQEHGVEQISLDFFGTQTAIEWHRIPNTRITPGERNLHGWVVISVSQLMRPEWQWLRESRTPDGRIGKTLFAYQLP